VASNGDALVVISLVGGIVVSPLPLEEFGLKNPGSPNGVCGTCGYCFPPWRTRCGSLLPHFLLQILLLVASQGGFGAVTLVVASVLLYFGGGLVASFVSVQFFFSFLLFVLGSFSINTCPTSSCRWLFGKKKATIFNDKLQYEEQSGYFKFYLKKIITTYQVKVYC
jgi:hypothetical protein